MGLRMSRDASKWKCAPGLETYENNSYGVCRTVAPANEAGVGRNKNGGLAAMQNVSKLGKRRYKYMYSPLGMQLLHSAAQRQASFDFL